MPAFADGGGHEIQAFSRVFQLPMLKPVAAGPFVPLLPSGAGNASGPAVRPDSPTPVPVPAPGWRLPDRALDKGSILQQRRSGRKARVDACLVRSRVIAEQSLERIGCFRCLEGRQNLLLASKSSPSMAASRVVCGTGRSGFTEPTLSFRKAALAVVVAPCSAVRSGSGTSVFAN